LKLVWTRTAIRDLVGIRRYIGHDNTMAAQDVASRILDVVNKLRKHPEMGWIGRVAGTPELVVSGTPYLVPYRIRAKAIELLRVLHGRQEWPKPGSRF
jgi:toxin ParE1/3/4